MAAFATKYLELTQDNFLGGKIKVWQPLLGYRASIDSVFLAAALHPKRNDSILELGCGVGTVFCCLLSRLPVKTFVGVEVQYAYAELARKNALQNNFLVEIIESDISKLPAALSQRLFDHVVFNPPFFKREASLELTEVSKNIALRESRVTLSEWIDIALRRCTDGGKITFIHEAGRLADIMSCLRGRAGEIRILPIMSKPKIKAKRILVVAKKGSKGAVSLLPPIIVHSLIDKSSNQWGYTDLAVDILKNGRSLNLS